MGLVERWLCKSISSAWQLQSNAHKRNRPSMITGQVQMYQISVTCMIFMTYIFLSIAIYHASFRRFMVHEATWYFSVMMCSKLWSPVLDLGHGQHGQPKVEPRLSAGLVWSRQLASVGLKLGEYHLKSDENDRGNTQSLKKYPWNYQ